MKESNLDVLSKLLFPRLLTDYQRRSSVPVTERQTLPGQWFRQTCVLSQRESTDGHYSSIR